MATKVLTDRAIKALKPAPAGKRVLVWDGIVPGLAVRITPTGAKSYVLVQRYPGSTNPTPRTVAPVGAMGLAEARTRARSWLTLIQQGVDPAIHEAQARELAVRAAADTVASVLELFTKHHLSTLRTGRAVAIVLRRVLAPWASRPVSGVSRRDVTGLVYAIHDGGARVASNRALA
jgi:hypothetical protein